MSFTNSHANYGSIAKVFHWMTALLILSAFALGLIAQNLPFETNDQLSLKANVFSAHKTVGILAFFTAFFRILWAFTQTRPGLLNADNKLEATAAETAHWLLYGSMLLVPLTGWVHHASTTGFAPVWLPFGNNLPFVPKSETVASFTATLHFLLVIVLGLTILAHIGGAMKHFVIDKDQTLQRMLPGRTPELEVAPHGRSVAPVAAALAVWAIAMTVGTFGGFFNSHEHGAHDHEAEAAELVQVDSDWQVAEGTLEIDVLQFGSNVRGTFADWTAQISFEEETVDGRHGDVTVEIAIGSLTLGSVTDQAMGADFFNVAEFPTATFAAELAPSPHGDDEYIADGTLTLKGVAMPLQLVFQLEIDGNTASMRGETSIQRLDHGIGVTMNDESNLGFTVGVSVALTAERQE
ncbi:MAG: cytochrome b/b6 domain-containing protein [Pseudomonadota bacterium]|nr:cytochrome b/b6 domain-containing protein [Pseudomonadota bacterium]